MRLPSPPRAKRMVWVGVAGAALFSAALYGQQTPVFEAEFTNAQLSPAHWRLKLNPDGSGQFDSDGGHPSEEDAKHILAGDVHRPVQVSPAFAEEAFSIARRRKLFQYPCESHLRVAFQGLKRLSYSGPEGSGSCEFNYSNDKEIEALGNRLVGLEFTIMSGAKLEKLMQHDRLGLDAELDVLTDAVHGGNAAEVGAIRETLERIASDDAVLERARRKAHLLLTLAR